MNNALAGLLKKSEQAPVFSVVLGTGFDIQENESCRLLGRIGFEEAGAALRGRVEGHHYQISLYAIYSRSILVFHGRFHLYEGYTQKEIVFPVETSKQAGIGRILLTCASGGLGELIKTGDIVRVTDHINLTGGNPIIYFSESGRDRFMDASKIYNNLFSDNLGRAVKEAGLEEKRAVLATMLGPSYETPAEAHFLKTIGADIVSMSVAPEAVFAHYSGMEVAGLSIVSNHHFVDNNKLSHSEVISSIKSVHADFQAILYNLVLSY